MSNPQRQKILVDAEALAQAVKSGQRASPAWKQAWRLWAEAQPPMDAHRGPPLDPNRWPMESLKSFLEEVGTAYIQTVRSSGAGFGYGVTPAVAALPPRTTSGTTPAPRIRVNNNGMSYEGTGMSADDVEKLVQFVKTGQRISPFKEMWVQHCQDHGKGTFDPRKHEAMFFVAFAFKYGVGTLGSEEWAQPYLNVLSRVAFPLLVHAIKTGQRADAEWKATWSAFCDDQGIQMKDPARHDPGSLLQFMEQHGVKNFATKPWVQCFLTGVMTPMTGV